MSQGKTTAGSGLATEQLFPFPLDPFQSEAIGALDQGYSVVVSAPTGSGKTLIGEYAIHRALSHGRRVYYTTPLKALSNQKLRDFRRQFGTAHVGLMTGDLSVNREASIIVMTTEIFRNMLYAELDGDDPLDGVEAVVLDECHYMNDSQRGTVWEESIIHCPTNVQLLALSATVANADQLKDWIERVHGPCSLICSALRPVPLQFGFCSAKGLHPLLNDEGTGLHPNCRIWRPPKGYRRKGRSIPKPPQPEPPAIGFVVNQLAERNMLPAIVFIFSRRGCDRAVHELAGTCLVNGEEQRRLHQHLQAFMDRTPDAVRDGGHDHALLRGIASHHAGVLPAWKELVEELFQQGLVKVVFATETLAAGINMPARSTVITALSKRTESGHRPLTASEFLQMAGRAGRRGLDRKGFVVTVQSRFEGAREAGQLATCPADPLASQFTPSYSMVLNLLQRYPLSKARELVERSFGRYLASLDLQHDAGTIQELEAQLCLLGQELSDVDLHSLQVYEKERAKLREERRLLRTLQQQSEETLAHELTLALEFASEGTLVTLKSPQLDRSFAAAVVVRKQPGPGQFPLLLCLTESNHWILLPCGAVVGFHAELSCLPVQRVQPPLMHQAGDHCRGNEASISLAQAVANLAQRHDLHTPSYDLAAEVQEQAQCVQEQQTALENHPVHRWQDRKAVKKRHRRMEELQLEISDHQQRLDRRTNRHWQTVLGLIDILCHFGCLVDLQATEVGRTVAMLRGDNELWLGLALMSGHLDELSPAELAAALEAISTEVNRPDIWCGYSTPARVEEALHDLRGLRRELSRQQERHNIDCPLWWEPELTGLVAAWAKGTSWNKLIANTSLDEGDVVRLLRRTVDVLGQIPHCLMVSGRLRRQARLAHNAINRFPVKEAEDITSARNPQPATAASPA